MKLVLIMILFTMGAFCEVQGIPVTFRPRVTLWPTVTDELPVTFRPRVTLWPTVTDGLPVTRQPSISSFTHPRMCYTQWFDRDNPSGNGDYETLADLRVEYPGKICPNPLSIDSQTLSGIPASITGQVFAYYDTELGFACVNSQQSNTRCLDYKVRFGCLCPWPRVWPIEQASTVDVFTVTAK